MEEHDSCNNPCIIKSFIVLKHIKRIINNDLKYPQLSKSF